MPPCRYQVIFPATAQDVDDAVVNTWYFRLPDLLTATIQAPMVALGTFYGSIYSLYPSAINLQGSNCKVYNMEDPKPRPPIHEGSLGIPQVAAGTGGPSEVAIVLSYHADYKAGMNKSRQRGRVYLGPLRSSQMINPRPETAMTNTIVNAATTLLGSSNAAQWKWIVWSQTQADSPQGNNFPDQTVLGGWVDNAFDTQRRRGITATSKSLFGLPG